MLPSFSSYTVSKCFLTVYLVPHLSTFCFLVILLHEMAPKYTAEGLYSVPQLQGCEVPEGEDLSARSASFRQELVFCGPVLMNQ